MTEETVPKPFPEARPPHLPDVLTRPSPWLFVFLAIAALVAWRSWVSWGPIPAGQELGSLLSLVTFSSSIIAPPLLGVALFARHPAARTTLPLLVFGLGLMALGSVLTAFADPIRGLLRATTSVSEFQTPGETAFLVFNGLVALFAVLYVAAGLSSARRAPRSRLERPVTIWLAAITVVHVVLSLRSVAEVVGTGEYPADIVVAVVLGVVLNVLSTLAWLYLTAVIVGGSLAGESPIRAWIAGAIGVLLLFISPVVVGLVYSIDPLGSGLGPVLNAASLAAWILLVVAFAIGLPSPSAPAEPAVATADPPVATPPGSAAG